MRSFFRRCFQRYNAWVTHQPLLGNAVTAAVILAMGDALQQKLEHRAIRAAHVKARADLVAHRRDAGVVRLADRLSCADADALEAYECPSMDWARTARFSLYGFAWLGPVSSLFYRAMEPAVSTVVKRFCASRLAASAPAWRLRALEVGAKVAADQLVASPIFISSFYISMSMMKGSSLAGGVSQLRDKFLITYALDYCVWPAAQVINFAFVPAPMRVLYISCIDIGWNALLSSMAYDKEFRATMAAILGTHESKLETVVSMDTPYESEDEGYLLRDQQECMEDGAHETLV